jgi:hypothetical protein
MVDTEILSSKIYMTVHLTVYNQSIGGALDVNKIKDCRLMIG